MVGNDTSLLGGLAAAGPFSINFILKEIDYKYPDSVISCRKNQKS
jgi:hypothetical protein